MDGLIRLDLRMTEDGRVYLDVAHRDGLAWLPGESAWLGHIRDVSLATPMLLSQLETLRGVWLDGRDQRRAEREEEAADYASLMSETWHGV